MPTTRWHWRAGVDLLQLKRTTAALLALRGQLRAEGLTPKLAPAGGVTLANALDYAHAGADRVIRDIAFPCRQNRCLTQTLHFINIADTVAALPAAPMPMPPARHGALGESRAEGVVTRASWAMRC